VHPILLQSQNQAEDGLPGNSFNYSIK
jgi:hypothetical protein